MKFLGLLVDSSFDQMAYHLNDRSILELHFTLVASLRTFSFRLIWCAKPFAGYIFHDICFNIRLGKSII